MRITSRRAIVPLLMAGGLLAAACGSSSSSSTTTTAASGGSSGGATVSVTTFTKNFTTMANLKSVTSAGKGKVAVILPDEVSSARYTEFDAPYLTKAFADAGLSTSDTIIQNAQGSDSTQLTDAQSDITSGATVLVVDPLDAGVGNSIESYAKAHGVPVVDYDRLVLGGSRKYYVSFDNVKVGTLIGKGMVSCVAAWKVASPNASLSVPRRGTSSSSFNMASRSSGHQRTWTSPWRSRIGRRSCAFGRPCSPRTCFRCVARPCMPSPSWIQRSWT